MYADKHRLKITAIVALLICSAIYTYGQDEIKTRNAIDTRLSICLDSAQNQNTSGICICNNKAENEWAIELDKYYNLLMDVLVHKEEKLKVSISQQNWLHYRDSEFSCAGTLYSNTSGTMSRIANSERRLEIVRQRAEELRTYYETMKDLR